MPTGSVTSAMKLGSPSMSEPRSSPARAAATSATGPTTATPAASVASVRGESQSTGIARRNITA